MREYPRRVYLTFEETRKVNNETEEIQAASEGYESHWDKEVIKREKGTDREILRGSFEKAMSEFSGEIKVNKPQIVKPLTRGQKAALTRKRNKERRLNGDG